MAKVRDYQFVVGAETATIPTAGTPSTDSDTMTKGYADKNYLQGRLGVADVTALKAVGSSDRSDKMAAYVESLNRLFFFDSGSSATGDDVLVIQPSSGSGRWIADLTSPTFQTVLGKEQASDPSTPSAGFRYLYPKSDGFYEKDFNGIVQKIGPLSLTSELNVIDNPSGASNVTDWVASGAGITVARTTTGSDLPLSGVIDTAIKVTPVSGTDYVRYRFTMPASMKSRTLKVEWEQRPLAGYSGGDLKLEVYKNSASDYSGSYTEFALSTDVTGTTSIPSTTGRFTTSFSSDSADYYELRIVRVSGTTALNLTCLFVGPGVSASGSIVASATDGSMPYNHAVLDDTAATRLGLKSYSHGTSYASGNAPTITLFSGGGTLSSITHSRFIPYQLQDGTWMLNGSFEAQVSSAVRTSAVFAINGVTFANDEAFIFSTDVAQNLTFGVTTATTGRLETQHQSATTARYRVNFSNTVCSSKPTWAY